MKATTKTQTAQLKVFKSGNYEYIYVYFKLRKGVIRVNTGNKFTAYKMTKELLFNASEPNHREANVKTLELLEKVNGYIKFKLSEYRGEVNQKECLHYITSSNYTRGLNNVLIRINDFTGIETQIKPAKTVMDILNDFITVKESELKGKTNSLGNYWSLRTNLTAYQTQKGKVLTFEQINTTDFVKSFREFLNTLHKYNNPEKYMSASSVHMRLNYLRTFYLWLISKKIYVIDKDVYDMKREYFFTPKLRLNKADLKQIMELKNLTAKEQIVVDMFVCNSLMGFRYSDLKRLTKANAMQHSTGETYIKQTTQKTEIPVTIEVQPTSLLILQKYNYEFPKMTLKTFNDRLQKVLENNNLFNEMVMIHRKENNTSIDIQVPRRTLVKSHTSRRNFVNICLDSNVPLHQICASTGHSSLSTLQKYVTRTTTPEAFRGIDIMTA
jgi:integrase